MASDILNTPPRPRKGIVATLVDGIRRRLNSRWPWLLAIIPVGLATGFFHPELVAIAWPLPGVIILATSIALALAVTPTPRAGLSLAAAVVAVPLLAGSAVAEERREFATAAEYVAAAEAHCVAQGRAVEPCMAEKRAMASAGLDRLAMMMPRLVERCEAEHSDPLAVVWCGTQAMSALRGSTP